MDQTKHFRAGYLSLRSKWWLLISLLVSASVLFCSCQSAMTDSPPLVNAPVAYVAFTWGGINLSNNLTAQSSSLDGDLFTPLVKFVKWQCECKMWKVLLSVINPKLLSIFSQLNNQLLLIVPLSSCCITILMHYAYVFMMLQSCFQCGDL